MSKKNPAKLKKFLDFFGDSYGKLLQYTVNDNSTKSRKGQIFVNFNRDRNKHMGNFGKFLWYNEFAITSF